MPLTSRKSAASEPACATGAARCRTLPRAAAGTARRLPPPAILNGGPLSLSSRSRAVLVSMDTRTARDHGDLALRQPTSAMPAWMSDADEAEVAQGDCGIHKVSAIWLCAGVPYALCNEGKKGVAAPVARVLAGRYELEALLGQGSSGGVWRARDITTRRVVAVKIIELAATDDPAGIAETVARFRREAAILARLRHPNVVSAEDATQVGNELFMVMEMADGMSLASR